MHYASISLILIRFRYVLFGMILIVMVLFVSGCSNDRLVDNVFHWPSSGVTEADSVLIELECWRTSLRQDGSNDSLPEKLLSISREYPDNKVLRFRAEFFMISRIPELDIDSLMKSIGIMETYLDSASNQYDWSVLKSKKSDVEPDMSQRYLLLMDLLRYYSRHGYAYEEGRTLNQLGNVMYYLNDTLRALDYYRRAEILFDHAGTLRPLIIAKMNVALCSPMNERDSMLSWLRNDSIVKKDSYLRQRVLQNSFMYTDSLHFLDESLELAERGQYLDVLPILLALKGDCASSAGDPGTGLRYINKGLTLAEETRMADVYLSNIHYLKSHTLYLLGEKDSAMNSLLNSMYVRDSLERTMNNEGIKRLDTLAAIRVAEQAEQLKRYRIYVRIVIVATVLLLLFAVFFLRWKKQEYERQCRQAVLEERQIIQSRALLVQKGLIDDNEQLISNLSRHLGHIHETGETDGDSAKEMDFMLRLHKSNEDNRKGMLKVSSEIGASFIANLKKDYPDLSKGQLRLASLIVSGYDSIRIGNMMNIAPASVYRGRSRLRIRLGLHSDDSLEDFLEKYNC